MRSLVIALTLALAAPYGVGAALGPQLRKPEARQLWGGEGFLRVEPCVGWNPRNRVVELQRALRPDRDWWLTLGTLAFQVESDYDEAVRLDGCLVQVTGYVVRNGWQTLVVVEDIREVVR